MVDMLPNREDKLGSVVWVRELRAPLQKDPDSETSGETSHIKQVLALLNSPLFNNLPPGNPEAIESVIEANRMAWDDWSVNSGNDGCAVHTLLGLFT